MSAERKDIRAKLDPDVHEALTEICDIAGVDLGEYVEAEITRVVQQQVHDYILRRDRFERLGLVGKIRAKAGKGH